MMPCIAVGDIVGKTMQRFAIWSDRHHPTCYLSFQRSCFCFDAKQGSAAVPKTVEYHCEGKDGFVSR